jgi:hypothetical protein
MEKPPALDTTRCPLCGSGNACGMAAGKEDCWCFHAEISAEVLERVPAEARNKACVCQGCATPAETLTPVRKR